VLRKPIDRCRCGSRDGLTAEGGNQPLWQRTFAVNHSDLQELKQPFVEQLSKGGSGPTSAG
jgi:hypothetical protein